jgi:hypothetical protein
MARKMAKKCAFDKNAKDASKEKCYHLIMCPFLLLMVYSAIVPSEIQDLRQINQRLPALDGH